MPDTEKPLLLYVEDDVMTQTLVEAVLRDEGYDVLTASDGHDALGKIASAPRQVYALITDVDLGDCPNGWQVAHRARVAYPGLPVLYMSGASIGEWSAKGVPDSRIVAKPFSEAQLVAAVDSLLSRADR